MLLSTVKINIKIVLFIIMYSGTISFQSFTIADHNKTLLAEEEKIIKEIQSLLQHGTVPSMSFKEWCNTHVPTLILSKKDTVKKLGLFFEKLTTGNKEKINPFKVLPIFEQAVQEYDQKFRIRTLKKPGIIAKGTYWYLKPTKKRNNIYNDQ